MLKTKTITTDKSTLLVVELPDGSHSVHVCKHIRDGVHYLLYDGLTNTAYKEFLPEGNWQLLGRLPDITELLAVTIVESIEYPFLKGEFCYPDYTVYGKTGFKAFDTALESLYSLLQANEVYFENKYGEEPNRNDDYYRDAMGVEYHYHEDLKKWQESQSKVWDRERTYLFTKEK